jgi:prolyl oligopeptidase
MKFLVKLMSVTFLSVDLMAQMKLEYPKTVKAEVTDNYFGTIVQDPYRWLENDTAADTKAWVLEQNKVTHAYLGQIPYRDGIKQRITELNNFAKYGAPFKAGDYLFFLKNNGLQNQAVWYYQKGLAGDPEVFLDPNTFSVDGTVSMNIAGISNDKKYLAYSLSKSGSDWVEISVIEIATKKVLTDKIQWVKFSGVTWKGAGFYYSRYDAPAKGTELSNKNTFQKVYYHTLGKSQDEDVLVYEDKGNPLRYYGMGITQDERFLFLSVSQGTGGNALYFKDLQSVKPEAQQEFRPITEAFDAENSVVDHIGDRILLFTNYKAPNRRLVLVDSKNPAPQNWVDFIKEEKNAVLNNVTLVGGKLFANYMLDVSSHIYQYSLEGKKEKEIKLPTIGNASGFDGDAKDTFTFYSFTSFTYPSTLYTFDITTGISTIFKKSELKFDLDAYETKQVFYSSKDGTKVPMFIVHKKGLKLDGTNPTLLYGYGGFNVSLLPSFSASRMVLLENGGVYALANIRGGGEYGEQWHEGGMKLNKQNVFDDFIAAAEYLIKEKYTSNQKLAIQGGSNGGLLVGACMTQRPELFKVAFPAVGVMDMLRFQKFTVGWGWVDDYGSSDSTKYFPLLYQYSPLHNLKYGVKYPATLVTTADHDDRVVPAHSFKFAARLQECHKGDNPVLIRIETKAGHGAGKSLSKQIEEVADIYSFMFYNMGIMPKY